MERVEGIEPSSSAWKAAALPLSYTRNRSGSPLLSKAGGRGWIRTSVRSRGQIYSLLPLTTRPPFRPCFRERQSACRAGASLRGARPIATPPPPLKPRDLPADRLPRRQFEEEAGGPSWVWGVHAALAVLANPARRVERVVATRNAASRLPAGVEPHILEPDAIDGMLPPGAVHQGLAVRAYP